MAKKLRCTVTGNWNYCSDERYAKLVQKFGSEDKLIAGYVSREGKKVQDGKGAKPDSFKNKIACTITGELCYISDERLKKLVKREGSEKAVREKYVSRVAKRLLKEGKTESEIRSLYKDGKLPAAAAKATEERKAKKAAKKNAPKPAKKAPAKKPADDKPTETKSTTKAPEKVEEFLGKKPAGEPVPA